MVTVARTLAPWLVAPDRRRRWHGRWAALLLLAASLCAADAGVASASARPAGTQAAAPDRCPEFLQPLASSAPAPVDAGALVRVRDIGAADDPEDHAALALAPDGKAVAFVMRRADPVANRICSGLFVLPLTSGATPRLIADGGDPILATIASVGLAAFPTGAMLTVAPRWSPDGRWVAFLKRANGHVAVWRARADGSRAEIAAALAADIEDFTWSPDGEALVVASRPALAAANRAIDAEAAGGYLYDARAFPVGSPRPLPLAGPQAVLETVTLATQAVLPATPAQATWLHPSAKDAPQGAQGIAVGRAGALAWRMPAGASAFQRTGLTARLAGREYLCPADACNGRLGGPWWSRDGRSLLFTHSGAGEDGFTRFLRWTPGTGVVRSLRREDAVYADCARTKQGLLCLREDPATPLAIVRLDPESGVRTTLFDPNPEISGHFAGRIQHLAWTDAAGARTFGHLILPPGADPARRLPLVVVQYRAAGFQRGGVGDETPILPLANAGVAILNVERPPLPAAYDDVDTYMRAAMAGWREERRVLAVIEAGVRLLVRRGIVDPGRVGIAGLSAGAQTAQFAMIHSTLFKAAAISTCCKDPVGTMVQSGPGLRAAEERWGLPAIESGNVAQWRDVSLAMNASHITTPILLQLSDWEFREALETVAAFRALGRPLELRIFPDEFHVKQQPAHRLAIYQRAIDWFDFWLRDKENDRPGLGDQYARWRQWKAQLRARTP